MATAIESNAEYLSRCQNNSVHLFPPGSRRLSVTLQSKIMEESLYPQLCMLGHCRSGSILLKHTHRVRSLQRSVTFTLSSFRDSSIRRCELWTLENRHPFFCASFSCQRDGGVTCVGHETSGAQRGSRDRKKKRQVAFNRKCVVAVYAQVGAWVQHRWVNMKQCVFA